MAENNLCPDWIYSDSSNIHVAKDKAWFTTYTPFPTLINSVYNIGAPTLALGIGTVGLKVQATPTSFQSHTIQLHNVLHAPGYMCNVLGRPLKNTYAVELGGLIRGDGPCTRSGLFLCGRQVAYFQPGPGSFFSLAVFAPQGRAFGLGSFQNETAWPVDCCWDVGERERWQAARDEVARRCEMLEFQLPYTVREVEFVNGRWGTEFRFLAEYRLRMADERDRSEGRKTVRALMDGVVLDERKGMGGNGGLRSSRQF